MKTIVLKIKGLSDEQIQEEFTELFTKLADKYPEEFGVGLSALEEGTDGERMILKIANLL